MTESSRQHPITISVNGERRTLPGPLTVVELVAHLGLEAQQVAVERNKQLVRRAEFAATQVKDGDALEIVTFFGGG